MTGALDAAEHDDLLGVVAVIIVSKLRMIAHEVDRVELAARGADAAAEAAAGLRLDP